MSKIVGMSKGMGMSRGQVNRSDMELEGVGTRPQTWDTIRYTVVKFSGTHPTGDAFLLLLMILYVTS